MDRDTTTKQDEKILAALLRAERKRLGLSVASVAHFCDVAHSTVVNWETNRARMPFVAAMELWRRGFDMERIVQSELPPVQVLVYGSERFGNVPEYLLLRHQVSVGAAFLYHNPHRLDDRSPAGELCLIRKLVDDVEAIVEQGDGIYLVRPHGKKEAFLCQFRIMPKNRVRIEAGGATIEVGMPRLLTHADVKGKYLCGLGLMPDDNPKDGAHRKALLALGRKFS